MNTEATLGPRAATTTGAVSIEPTVDKSQTPPASYNGLPTELKLEIWDQTHHHGLGTVIPIQCSPAEAQHNAESNTRPMLARIKKYLQRQVSPIDNAIPENWVEFGPSHRFTSPVTAHPQLYFVDKFWRELATKSAERLFPRHSIHGYIMADLSKDILLLSPRRSESSIAPAVGNFLSVLSSDQKSRVKYAAVECVILPVPENMQIRHPGRITNHRLPCFEPNVVEYMFTKLKGCLEIVALVGGYGKEGNILGKGKKNSTLTFLDIRRDVGHDKNIRALTSTTEASPEVSVWIDCIRWRANYVRRDATGDEVPVELHIGVYFSWLSSIFRMDDDSWSGLGQEAVAARKIQRAKMFVEQIARHYTIAANG